MHFVWHAAYLAVSGAVPFPCGQAAMHSVVALTMSLVGAGLPRHLAAQSTSDLQAVTHFCCAEVGWGEAADSVEVWAATAATRPKARNAAENFIVG